MEAVHSSLEGRLKGTPVLTLVSGDLEADFLPACGMLCMSLRDRQTEILRRVENLETAASRGSTAAIPLLHPWANRLSSLGYCAAGIEVNLDYSSPDLHFDENDLPIHGVPWSRLVWETIETSQKTIVARLDWRDPKLLRIFPFRHRLELRATLRPDALTFETTLAVGGLDEPVPVSFGFHPYLGIPNLPRSEWRLKLPPMRRLVLDQRGIPTGDEEPFRDLDAMLGNLEFDDAFSLLNEQESFSIAGGDRTISVDLLGSYRFAQVFAPKNEDYIALEPMTAPTDSLNSGHGLRLVRPGEQFRAAFRIRIGVAR